MKIEGRDCFSHRVKITNFFEGILYIPEEMDAMDLKALTQQANQIFKISQMDQQVIPEEQIDKPVVKRGKSKNKSKVDIDNIIALHKQGLNCRRIRKETGYSYKQVYYGLKRNGYEPILVNENQNKKPSKARKPILGRMPGDIPDKDERYKLLVEYYQCVDTIDREKFAKKHNLNLLQFQKATTAWKAQTGFKQ